MTLSWCIGCGNSSLGNTAHLEGTVTLGGQPLPADAEGAITFRPTQSGQGRPVTVTIVDGKYDSPETPKGALKVFVSIVKPTGRMLKSERTGGEYQETASIVSAKYGDGIDLDVAGDKADQNFDLASE